MYSLQIEPIDFTYWCRFLYICNFLQRKPRGDRNQIKTASTKIHKSFEVGSIN